MNETKDQIILEGNPYSEYITFLTGAYNYFNQKLTNCEAPNVVITVQTRGRRPALGWFWDKTWKDDKGNLFAEINICAERLDRPMEDLLETLIHELAHVLNNKRGVKDCNSSQYHNKNFKKTAEELGLIVKKLPGKGYAITELGPTTKAIVTEFLENAQQPIMTISRVNTNSMGKVLNKVFSIPATQECKAWFEYHSNQNNLSQKDLLSKLIETYMTHNELVHE